MLRNAGQDDDSTEVLDSRTTQRRGTSRKEFLVRLSGERQPQWMSQEQLRQYMTSEEIALILDAEGAP